MKYQTTAQAILDQILQTKPNGIIIFDLDSTLYHTHLRNQVILREWSQDSEAKKKFPKECLILEKAETLPCDWGYMGLLSRTGLSIDNKSFLKSLHQYWEKRFFSSEYLIYDEVMEGAPEFVLRLYQNGFHIHYLTGRDEPRMLMGTIKSLKNNHFPLETERVSLTLKPHKNQDDVLFKKNFFSKINSLNEKNIWFFDNEPLNIQAAQEASPHVHVVFLDCVHSQKAPAPTNIPYLKNFLLDLR